MREWQGVDQGRSDIFIRNGCRRKDSLVMYEREYVSTRIDLERGEKDLLAAA